MSVEASSSEASSSSSFSVSSAVSYFEGSMTVSAVMVICCDELWRGEGWMEMTVEMEEEEDEIIPSSFRLSESELHLDESSDGRERSFPSSDIVTDET